MAADEARSRAPEGRLPSGGRARVALALLALAFVLTLALVVHEVFLAPSEVPVGPTRQRRLSQQTRYVTSHPEIDALQAFFRPALQGSHKEFAGRLGRVRGFGAGETYPQIWVRDSAAILQLSRYLYPREELVTWIEELLAAQRPDGGIVDWIAPGAPGPFLLWAPDARAIFQAAQAGLTADTNTTEADQEASLVGAVHAVHEVTADTAWLRKDILGGTVLGRCEEALGSLGRRRRDPATGLITSGFTGDWGDVSPAYADQRAIYLDANTPRAVGLYTNALYCRATLQLAELLEATGAVPRAQAWREEAARMREAINRQLWQEHRGFYRMHRVVTPALARGLPDDSDIFAVGGHALALGELADGDRVRSIIEVAERRQRDHGLATIAASLVPPFPAGTFGHAAMREEWRYLNGGQWDWFAGRFVLAEFRRGHSEQAFVHLTALARRALAAGGLFEWYERDGSGRGSPRHAGSAAGLADAIYHGLFGVALGARGAALDVRLGGRDGAVEVREPASGRVLTYTQRIEASGSRLILTYAGNVDGIGRLRVRLPPGAMAGGVLRDGAPSRVTVERVGDDAFVALETDWGMHRLEVELVPERGASATLPAIDRAPGK